MYGIKRAGLIPVWMIFLVTLSYAGEKHVFLNQNLALHDVTLMATDVQKLAGFYTKIGFGRDPHVNTEDIVVFPLPAQDLAIHKAEKNSTIGVSFKVRDLEALIEKLKENKVAFTGPKMLRPGLEGIDVKDPNGNTISFLRPVKK